MWPKAIEMIEPWIRATTATAATLLGERETSTEVPPTPVGVATDRPAEVEAAHIGLGVERKMARTSAREAAVVASIDIEADGRGKRASEIAPRMFSFQILCARRHLTLMPTHAELLGLLVAATACVFTKCELP